jgi:peptide/nickel transport system permease protein
MLHGRASDEVVAEMYRQLGMDRPLILQYVSYLGNAAMGDLGVSIIQKAPVSRLVGERVWNSLFLLAYGSILGVIFAVPLSILSAIKRNRLSDHCIRIGGMVGFAMPPFWIGLLLILFFGLYLNMFPIAGAGEGFVGHLHHLFLPALTIALFLTPILVQSLRSSMLDVLTAEYIEVARSKGLSETRIVLKHVLRNALIPVITVLAVNISWLVSGAVIVEYVFTVPGLGSLLVRAVSSRDYPVIQGLALVFALIVVVVNLMADISYMLVDRRVIKD